MADSGELPLFAWGAAHQRAAAVRRRCLLVGFGLAALGVTFVAPPPPLLVWNASASAPLGLYWVEPGATIRRGDMVVLWFPAAARNLAARRCYLPHDVPAVKRVVGIAGDRICAKGALIAIDGRPAASRRVRDRSGRPLAWWRGCRTLGETELFVMMANAPESYDGRYFGPVPRANVIGRARLLWAR